MAIDLSVSCAHFISNLQRYGYVTWYAVNRGVNDHEMYHFGCVVPGLTRLVLLQEVFSFFLASCVCNLVWEWSMSHTHPCLLDC